MFNNLGRSFRCTSSKVKKKVSEELGILRRYQSAGIKAYQAASEFLKSPDHVNVFEPLTPILLESEQSSRYEQELLEGLKSDQVRNIALTGEYGAGKSSVIRTFVDRHPEFSYAFVSLATFGRGVSETECEDEKSNRDTAPSSSTSSLTFTGSSSDEKIGAENADPNLLTRIEETIVQQLLYAVPADKLPKTRLKRITHASANKLWWKTFIYGVLILAVLRLYASITDRIISFEPAWLVNWILVIPGPAAMVVAALGCVYFLHTGLRLISLFSIDGLTLKGGKLETTHHGSVLHKNIDEIIYCFERSNIDVVVIEDLDRFGIHDVFTRLREINFIIKQSPQVKRPVYFVYALRDEMFVVGEKTKFFDLIIPVVPVINSENSREKMVELLSIRSFKGKPLDTGLDSVLVETVCYYISDMRVLKNIVNEFDIFSSILATTLPLDPNKLFAIVAIRNLHPRAYSELVKRQGPIYDVMQGLQAWKEVQAYQYDEKVKILRQQREERVQEVAKSVDELRAFVWFSLMKSTGANGATHVLAGNDSHNAMEFQSDQVFEKIFNQDTQLRTHIYDGYMTNRSPQTVRTTELLNSTSYQKRYEVLQISLSQLASDIATLQRKSTKISRMSFRSAAKVGYGEVIRQKLEGHDVVSYLMIAGYFDTDYADYYGYFYEGSLTPNDKNLILEIRRGAEPEVTVCVENPKTLLQKLESEDLDNGRGIIAELIAYLSTQPYQNTAPNLEEGKLGFILRGGLEGNIDRLAEATQELLQRSDVIHFIRAVFKLEPRIFRKLFEAALFFDSIDLRQSLVYAIFNVLERSEIGLLTKDEKTNLYPVVDALEDISDLMPALEAGEGAWALLRERRGIFGHLGDNMSLDDLKNLIVWRCIQINLGMLSLICAKSEVEQNFPAVEFDSTHSKIISYQRLKILGIEGLDDLLFYSPENFVRELLNQSVTLGETTDSLTILLANLSGQNELAAKLFDNTECDLHNLIDAPNSLWPNVLEADRVIAKTEAVWTFFEKYIKTPSEVENQERDLVESDQILASFITRHVHELAGNLWGHNSSDVSLQRYLIISPKVSNEILKQLLTGVILKDASILSESLPDNRWPMLIDSNFLPFSSEVWDVLVTQNSELEGSYLASRWADARSEIELSDLPFGTLLILCKATAPSISEKIKIWSSTEAQSFDDDEQALKELAHFCSDLNRQNLCFPASFIPVLKLLLTRPQLKSNSRAEMLIQCMPSMGWPEASIVLGQLSDRGFTKLGPTVRKIEVPKTDVNLRLVAALKTKGFLSQVTQSDENINATTKPSLMK